LVSGAGVSGFNHWLKTMGDISACRRAAVKWSWLNIPTFGWIIAFLLTLIRLTAVDHFKLTTRFG
jgi:hypothetical protein